MRIVTGTRVSSRTRVAMANGTGGQTKLDLPERVQFKAVTETRVVSRTIRYTHTVVVGGT